MSKPKLILICEDDPEIVDIIKIVLSKEGYQTISYEKVDETLPEKVQMLKPSVILMDLRMPEIGGEKAVESLKEDKRTSEIPIIIISANSNLHEIATLLDVSDCLSKPFNLSELKAAVKRTLKDNLFEGKTKN